MEDPSRRIAFYETYREKVRAIPGVRFAGEISRLPITGEYHSWGYLIRSESEETGEAVWHLANIRVAGGDYFEALGIDLLHGRTFTAADHLDAPAVVLVNKAFADRYFTDSDPVGEQVWVSGWREIAGVVSDIRIGFRTETPDKIYLPYNQFASDRPWVMAHVVAGEGDRNNLIESIRSEISAVDPGLIIFNIRTMNEIAGSAIAREQFALILMTIFAAVALGLAIMGIYGVLSYVVSQRHQEIGIRMALGAHNKLIRRLIIREGLVLTTAGIASGIIAALILTRWLDSLLFEVSALDSFTFIFAALLLGIVAWAACFIPAIRATRTDPVEILHSE